jgi:hypothetical protein
MHNAGLYVVEYSKQRSEKATAFIGRRAHGSAASPSAVAVALEASASVEIASPCRLRSDYAGVGFRLKNPEYKLA